MKVHSKSDGRVRIRSKKDEQCDTEIIDEQSQGTSTVEQVRLKYNQQQDVFKEVSMRFLYYTLGDTTLSFV